MVPIKTDPNLSVHTSFILCVCVCVSRFDPTMYIVRERYVTGRTQDQHVPLPSDEIVLCVCVVCMCVCLCVCVCVCARAHAHARACTIVMQKCALIRARTHNSHAKVCTN